MKVTVCFDSVRIVVPCGAGELLVRDLITEATRRYKKASGKCPDSWVEVHHLQTQSGILDPDDRVADVADDREQILASYEVDRDRPTIGQGDGASGGSSVGTGSPDIFRGSSGKYSPSHIEVTGGRGDPSPGLQVRRGSEPTLIGQGTESRVPPTTPDRQDPTKRWSAAPICRDDEDESAITGVSSTNGINTSTPLSNGGPVGYSGPPWMSHVEHSPDNEINVGQFQRSGRLSMQFLGDGNGARWAEAAERASAYHALAGSKSLPRESRRKEPLGQANTTNGYHTSDDNQHHDDDAYETTLVLGEAGAPLGLHAAREGDGLLVQAVEPGGRAARGRVQPGDLVLSIDGTELRKLPLRAIEDLFRGDAPELRLRIRRRRNPAWSHVGLQNGGDKVLIEADERPVGAKVATVSPTKKMPGRPPSLLVSNTRRLGKRLELSLRKGPHGLGFSVTTRDNPAGGHCPVYIKNILPRGAAVEDGRLQPGDRLLEVNGETMTGRTQAEVVAVLRATPPGATVTIAVSRQENGGSANEREIGFDAPQEEEPAQVPEKILNTTSEENIKPEKKLRESQREKSYSAASLPWKHREVMTFDIPVNDTEKAGLGVSVKGKTGSPGSASAGGDLGIFVKSVLHGGAASRDGRLKTNDQLLNVNGMSLQHQSNAEAMETLRRAMLHSGGRIPGSITLTVARKISHNHSSGSHGHNSSMSSHKMNISSAETERIGGNSTMDENEDLSEQSSDRLMDTQEANTVIYVPNRKPVEPVETWNNPVVERLTGMGSSNNYNPGLRNESYYMATNNTWVSGGAHSRQGSLTVKLPTGEAVLIEDDTTDSITRPIRNPNKQLYEHRDLNGSAHHNDLGNSMNDTGEPQTPSDATYASQLSLNNGEEAFSRDAIGRRSMSEKHHAALDAKGTGTYQRNKKLREERERERLNGSDGRKAAGSIESLASMKRGNDDLASEAKDRVCDLGPSLGLKKSSSLESLQTMVQELQMGDSRIHPGLRPIRGRACGDSLRAVVEAPSDTHPRKHWLTDDASDRAFPPRNDPILSSLNDGKSKNNRKKHRPGLLKGIGSMFRFGKHRKDGVADITPDPNTTSGQAERPPMPPRYQNPPPVVAGNMPPAEVGNMTRYSHYVNYEEIQNHLSSRCDRLSESQIAQMRRQVLLQRGKVEEESRRQQLYHSTRSNRSEPHQRPVSSYYEYESVQWAKGNKPNHYQKSPTRQQNDIYQTSPNDNNGLYAKHAPQPYKKPQSPQNTSQGSNSYNLPGAVNKQNVGLPRTRGPYITQVMIKEQTGSKV